jgi:predicted metal-binding protein
VKKFEQVDRFDKQDANANRWIYMCHSGGYVMAKHPRCPPTVFTLKEWAKFDRYERPTKPATIPTDD